MTAGPLDGVRVVDLTAMLAGPYSTMLLADLGAHVVKVEPAHGDMTRTGPSRDGDGPDALPGYFMSVNRGKRSVVLDLKADLDRAKFLDLVRNADIVVENFSSGVMDRLGLGYEVLSAENPRLVYAAIRGFGDVRTGDSPYREWPAFDVVAQAMGGFLGITGTPDGTPIKSGPGIGDLFPATLLAVGMLSALHHAQKTGQGQFVDVAMYDAVLSMCERIVYQHSYSGLVPTQQGNTHPMLCPFGVFRTADGWVSLAAAPSDRHWTLLAEAIGRPDMATDERYATNNARVRHSSDVLTVLDEWLLARTTAEVLEAVGGKVPVGPVNSVVDIFADPHVRAREMLVEVDQPGGDPVTIAGQPIKLTRTPSRVHGRGPLLGEHDVDDVIAEWKSQN